MTAKQQVDKAAAEALIEQIDATERKLRMMKQYINPEKGVINDMHMTAGLFNSVGSNMKTINDLLVRFI